MAELFKNYIAGEWVAGASVSANRNPSDTSDIIGEYAQADAEQARSAIAAAKKAFPAWSTGSIQERANILDRAGMTKIDRYVRLFHRRVDSVAEIALRHDVDLRIVPGKIENRLSHPAGSADQQHAHRWFHPVRSNSSSVLRKRA